MAVGRRKALQVIAGTGAIAAANAVPVAAARTPKVAPPDALGMLYDTTLCIGCKACVSACREANDLQPSWDEDRLHHAPLDLNGRTKTVIKLYKDDERMSYVKAQCMHCVDPACAGACMLGSLHKDEVTGIVSYDPTYCVGCRYCMMSCPFNVAKFEFDKAVPKIVKCELCRHRFGDAQLASSDGFSRFPTGHGPACCEVCPRGAVIYGKRTELLQEAKRRIEANPGRYHQDEIYGETDAGGTQVLYLSHLPFDRLGLPDIGARGVPHVAYAIQEGLYQGFVAPVALYGVLGLVMLRNRKKGAASAPEAQKGGRRE